MWERHIAKNKSNGTFCALHHWLFFTLCHSTCPCSSFPLLCLTHSLTFFPNLSPFSALWLLAAALSCCLFYLSDCHALSLSLRSSDVNPLQGSAFWGFAKWHPCYPECSAAGQGHIHLQCPQLPGSWQVKLSIPVMSLNTIYHVVITSTGYSIFGAN